MSSMTQQLLEPAIDHVSGPGDMYTRLNDLTGKEVGRIGEDIAADYLGSLGYRILDRNWNCRYGELDIVALSPPFHSKQFIVVAEVKTRRTDICGSPLEAVTDRKLAHLRRAAFLWLDAHPHFPHHPMRIDVIGISLHEDEHGYAPIISHVKEV